MEVSDDLALLENEYIPEEWKTAVGSDGKLVKHSEPLSGENFSVAELSPVAEMLLFHYVHALMWYIDSKTTSSVPGKDNNPLQTPNRNLYKSRHW